jgi:large subunit ribosomal protein L3
MKINEKDELEKLITIEDETKKVSSIKSSFYFIKKCMSTIMKDDGRQFPVTILQHIKSHVLSVDFEKKQANVFVEMSGKINQPIAGVLSKHGKLNDSRFQKMMKDDSGLITSKQKGKIKTVQLYNNDFKELNFDQFQVGDMIDISGISKGKGFTGRIKRWNHKRRPETHGSSLDHRCGGSTGGFQNRSKTKPGVHAAGHMGCKRVTMQNLQVIAKYTDLTGEFLCVHGSVPGPNKGFLCVRRAIKYETNKN